MYKIISKAEFDKAKQGRMVGCGYLYSKVVLDYIIGSWEAYKYNSKFYVSEFCIGYNTYKVVEY